MAAGVQLVAATVKVAEVGAMVFAVVVMVVVLMGVA